MGKVKKAKQHQKFNYNKDRKKNWKKAKSLPEIKCAEIKKAWDEAKSIKRNLKDMGICTDPNKTLKIPSAVGMKMGKDLEKIPIKNFVMQELEDQSTIHHCKKMSLSDEDAGFCVHLMDKYGEDYKAMARDESNYYQETPKQIKRKINRFKSIPNIYQIYLKAREGDHSK